MAVKVDDSKLQRKIRTLSRKVKGIGGSSLHAIAVDVVHNIGNELYESNYEGQVGFNPRQFIERLEQTITTQGDTIIIDPKLAGGGQSDLDSIAGVRIPASGVAFGDRGETSLWHEGHHRSDDFYRFVYSRPRARSIIGEAREQWWGRLTPQWFLVNYGSMGVNPPQPPQLFLERGADRNFIRRTARRRIREAIERDRAGLD